MWGCSEATPRYTLPQLCARFVSGQPVSLSDVARASSLSPRYSDVCTPTALLDRLMLDRDIDASNVTAVLEYLCPPSWPLHSESETDVPASDPLHMFRDGVTPALPKLTSRVVIWTTMYVTGGPEAWMQLWSVLHAQGYDTAVYVTPTAEYNATARSNHTISDWFTMVYGAPTVIESLEDLRAGDVLLARSDISKNDSSPLPFFCDTAVRLRERGVRVHFWLLGMQHHHLQVLHDNCSSLFSHSDMSRMGVLSHVAQIEPYLKDREHLSHACPAAASKRFVDATDTNKTRLVLFDGDSFEFDQAAELFRVMLDMRTELFSGILLQLIPRTQVYYRMREARVAVDRYLPGMERVPLESVLCGAVIVIGEAGHGGSPPDFPVPRALTYPDGDADRLPSLVTTVLDCYDDLQPLMWPLFHRIIQLPPRMPLSVRRWLATDLYFVTSACNDAEEAHVAAFVAAVLSQYPLAVVEVFVRDAAAFAARVPGLLDLNRVHFMHWNWLMTGAGSQCGPPHVFTAALNPSATNRVVLYVPVHRIVVLPDMAYSEGVRRVVRATHADGRVLSDYITGATLHDLDHTVVAIDTAQPACGDVHHRLAGCHPLFVDDSNLNAGGLTATREAITADPAIMAALCTQPLWQHLLQVFGPAVGLPAC